MRNNGGMRLESSRETCHDQVIGLRFRLQDISRKEKVKTIIMMGGGK